MEEIQISMGMDAANTNNMDNNKGVDLNTSICLLISIVIIIWNLVE